MREYEVIIPVRNGGAAVVHSIESVLQSAHSSRLLLTISDNFSTDGSRWREVLERYPAESWRVITPPEPLGRVEHWGWAFSQARLDWVKPLMVGDRIDDAFWSWLGQARPGSPEAGLFFCQALVIDPLRAHPDTEVNAIAAPAETRPYTHAEFVRDAIRAFSRPGALSQILVRADILRKALPFEPGYPWTADWRFYEKCLLQAPAAHTAARLVWLDRSIVRLSTSWSGLRRGFREEWGYAAEQARQARLFPGWGLLLRSGAVGRAVVFKTGRAFLPKKLRRILTRATGLAGTEA